MAISPNNNNFDPAPVVAESFHLDLQDRPSIPTIELTESFDMESQDGASIPMLELTDSCVLTEEDSSFCDVIALEQEDVFQEEVTATMAVARMMARESDVDWGCSTRFLSEFQSTGEFVSVTFPRMGLGNTGISYKIQNNEVIIESIEKGSPAGQSPLQVGDKVISINNKSCSSLISCCQSLDKFLGTFTGGYTLVARHAGGASNIVQVTVTKASQSQKCGIGLQHSISRNQMIVSTILPGSLFSDSLLNVGDQVLSINGVSCTSMDGNLEATNTIKNAKGCVTIVAKRQAACVLAEVSTRSSQLVQRRSTLAVPAFSVNANTSSACTVPVSVGCFGFGSTGFFRRIFS